MNDKPNILFIVVDCLRSDRCFDDGRSCRTSTIDFLKSEGACFTKTISTSTSTGPCFGSLLTGQYPFGHGLRRMPDMALNKNSRTIAEVLGENGYYTYAEVSGPLSQKLGINRGFSRYNYRNIRDNIYSKFYENLIAELKSNKLKQPWFLFLHFWDIHDPRRVTYRFDRPKFGKNLYERSLSNFDHKLKYLIEQINVHEDVIILTGDHGEKLAEGFFEDLYNRAKKIYYPFIKWRNSNISKKASQAMERLRMFKLKRGNLELKGAYNRNEFGKTHGYGLYNYLIEVPLIFVGKKYFPELKFHKIVRHTDIFPTILDLLKIKNDGTDIHGKSLFPIINKEEDSSRIAYSELFLGDELTKKNLLVSIRFGDYHLLYYPFRKEQSAEFYNVTDDPKEKVGYVEDAIRNQMYSFAKEINPEIEADELTLGMLLSKTDEEEVKKILNSLGYFS